MSKPRPQLRTRRNALTALLALPMLARPAWGQDVRPQEVSTELPSARLLGRGSLRVFGLHIYDARLWVSESFKAERFERHPLALELQYGRSLDGERIAERSLAEMNQQGELPAPTASRWLAEMKQSFPNVARGDRITGVLRPGESARFFVNGRLHREVRDAEFAQRFFAIWLSPRSSVPALRKALLGSP